MSRRMTREDKAAIERAGLLHQEVEQLRAEVERLRLRLRLTALEVADLEMWREECCHQSRTATAAGEVEYAERWAARADRTLALLARLGGAT